MKEQKDVSAFVHGDDFDAVGAAEPAKRAEAILAKAYKIRQKPLVWARIGEFYKFRKCNNSI